MPEKITLADDGSLCVPDEPIIPFIEGDGIGPEIWAATRGVLDVASALTGKSVAWKEVFAGDKAHKASQQWLPSDTVDAFRDHLVGMKGPLATPVGGGVRSLNVALRQLLDLYACVRPIRWFSGVPSPVKEPNKVDVIVFRENVEDVYAGLELSAGSDEAKQLIEYLSTEFGWKIRGGSGIGAKPISAAGSKRLQRAALNHAIANGRRRVTWVHQGNIMKFTEGAFREWGDELVRESYADTAVLAADLAEEAKTESSEAEAEADAAARPTDDRVVVDNAIADSVFQRLLTDVEDFDVIATTNLNGDFLSRALAGQVGGIGLIPSANINFVTGHAIFEAAHGTAPDRAGGHAMNPIGMMLAGSMLFDHIGWGDAAAAIVTAIETTIADRVLTGDLTRHLDGVDAATTEEFGAAVVDRLE